MPDTSLAGTGNSHQTVYHSPLLCLSASSQSPPGSFSAVETDPTQHMPVHTIHNVQKLYPDHFCKHTVHQIQELGLQRAKP